jgi:hypothetical protein
MNRFEKISIALSSAALLISMAAAVLTSYATYKWFDPAEKELDQRGILQLEQTETVEDCAESSTRAENRIHSTSAILRNVGRRPVKDIEISIAHPESASASDLKVEMIGFVLERPLTSKTTSIFKLGSVIAPAESVTLVVSGKFTSVLVHPQTVDPVIHIFDERDLCRYQGDWPK